MADRLLWLCAGWTYDVVSVDSALRLWRMGFQKTNRFRDLKSEKIESKSFR